MLSERSPFIKRCAFQPSEKRPRTLRKQVRFATKILEIGVETVTGRPRGRRRLRDSGPIREGTVRFSTRVSGMDIPQVLFSTVRKDTQSFLMFLRGQEWSKVQV